MSKDVKDYKEIQEIQNLQEQLKACKNCLHYEACKGTYYSAKGDEDVLYDFDGEMYADSGCEDFEDKDHITRQKAEIERLESLCEKIGIANDAKFERICVLQEDLETAKSEAYKEFAYKLKEKARVEDDDYSPNGERSIIEVDDVDNLLIELENKNNDRN